MEPHWPIYRVYHLGADGHIESAEVMQATNDEEALEQLRSMTSGHGIELWDRSRIVAVVRPEASVR